MCGDICTKIYSSPSPCTCNGTTLKYDSPEFCCTSHDDLCSFDGLDSAGNVNNPRCSSGSPTNKDEGCPDRKQRQKGSTRCYNSYQHSKYFADEAHYSCPDGRCVVLENAWREFDGRFVPEKGSFLEERCRGVEGGLCSNHGIMGTGIPKKFSYLRPRRTSNTLPTTTPGHLI